MHNCHWKKWLRKFAFSQNASSRKHSVVPAGGRGGADVPQVLYRTVGWRTDYQQQLTGTKVTRVGADTIYANNENRRYCTENSITTCFVRKGPKLKDENVDISTARRIIGTLRSTVMEGSFGNQKQHYNVGRIAARNSRSETLQLFFGIQCANAAILAARQLAIEEKRKQRKKRWA